MLDYIQNEAAGSKVEGYELILINEDDVPETGKIMYILKMMLISALS